MEGSLQEKERVAESYCKIILLYYISIIASDTKTASYCDNNVIIQSLSEQGRCLMQWVTKSTKMRGRSTASNTAHESLS